MLATDRENRYGDELRQARLALALSVKKLSKLSAVSRRHITTAEQGGNISIDVLKKLMRALGMSRITLADDIHARAELAHTITPEVLHAVTADVQRSAELARNAAVTLRTFTSGVGKSTLNDTPLRKGLDDETDGDAATLIGEFAQYVRGLRDPARLAEVGEAVSGLLRSEASGSERSPARGAKRRRRTA